MILKDLPIAEVRDIVLVAQLVVRPVREDLVIGRRGVPVVTVQSGGNDLDIPGAELDDLQEDIGSEDEENNYYSLGGEDHLDLEEDQGEYGVDMPEIRNWKWKQDRT